MNWCLEVLKKYAAGGMLSRSVSMFSRGPKPAHQPQKAEEQATRRARFKRGSVATI